MEEEPEIKLPAGVQGRLEGFPDVPVTEDSGQIRGRSKPWVPKGPYRARYKDVDDRAVAEINSSKEGSVRSPEEVEAGRPYQEFMERFQKEHGSLDVVGYLDKHPEDVEVADEARRLGLID